MNVNHSKKPAIVFDFGGVLFEWDPFLLYGRFFNNDPAAVENFLNEIGFAEWNLQQDMGRSFAEAVADLSRRFPHHAHLIKAYDDLWVESIAGAILPTVEILRSLKQAGYPLYALSNWSTETLPRIWPRYPFLDWFDTILLSGEVKVAKPDPRIFQVFLKRVQWNAEECLFIDDSADNIATARQMGFQTVQFESPSQLKIELIRRDLLVE